MVLFKMFSFPLWDHTMIAPIFMLFCLGLPCLGAKLLRCRFLLFLGDVSYSAYLLHIVFVILIHYGGRNWDSIVGTLFGYVIFTYVTAYFCYRYFETSMRRIVRDFFMNGCNSVKGEKSE